MVVDISSLVSNCKTETTVLIRIFWQLEMSLHSVDSVRNTPGNLNEKHGSIYGVFRYSHDIPAEEAGKGRV